MIAMNQAPRYPSNFLIPNLPLPPSLTIYVQFTLLQNIFMAELSKALGAKYR